MKMPRIVFSLSVAAALAAATPALAADVDPAFQDVVHNPGHEAKVLDLAKHSTTWIKNPCADAKFSPSQHITLYKTPVFDKDHVITSGIWKESVTAKGCGTERQLNVLVSVNGKNALHNQLLLPGDTHADPQVQADAAAPLQHAVGPDAAGCDEYYIADTHYTGTVDAEMGAAALPPPWREEWTVMRCNVPTVVTMQFSPQDKGATLISGHLKTPASAPPVLVPTQPAK